MNEQQFDRLARMFSRVLSRRSALVGAGGALMARSRPAKAASQIEIAACGEAGAVCTQIKGCCEGLVCATSYANPAYGVCVTGEGDMMAVSDDIVVPGAEGVTDELAAEVSAAGATDAESVLVEQEAEIQARKDARRVTNDTQRSRRRTNRNNQGTQRRANHGDTHEKKVANRTENELARDAKKKPKLTLRLFTADDEDPETLYIENRDEVSVLISRVQSIKNAREFDTSGFSILPDDIALLDTLTWTNKDICTGDEGDGVEVTATKSGATKKHELTVRCPKLSATRSAETESLSRAKNGNKGQTQKRLNRGKGD